MSADRPSSLIRLRVAGVLVALVYFVVGAPEASARIESTAEAIARLEARIDELERRLDDAEEAASEFKAFSEKDAVTDFGGPGDVGRSRESTRSGSGSTRPRVPIISSAGPPGGSASGSGFPASSNPDRSPSRDTGGVDRGSMPSSSPEASRFEAPFVIVDGAGRELFRVERAGDTGKPSVTVSDGRPLIRIGGVGDGAAISMGDGDSRLLLSATSKESHITVRAGDESAILAGDGDGAALRMQKSGKVVAALSSTGLAYETSTGARAILSQPSGRNLGLRFHLSSGDDHNAFVGLGPDGNGAVQVGDAQGVVAYMFASGGGLADVSVVFQGKPVASMNTIDMGGEGVLMVRNAAGQAVSFLTSNNGGGNFTATAPGGVGIFSAGWAGDEGAACVNTRSGQWCMGKNLPLQH